MQSQLTQFVVLVKVSDPLLELIGLKVRLHVSDLDVSLLRVQLVLLYSVGVLDGLYKLMAESGDVWGCT